MVSFDVKRYKDKNVTYDTYDSLAGYDVRSVKNSEIFIDVDKTHDIEIGINEIGNMVYYSFTLWENRGTYNELKDVRNIESIDVLTELIDDTLSEWGN